MFEAVPLSLHNLHYSIYESLEMKGYNQITTHPLMIIIYEILSCYVIRKSRFKTSYSFAYGIKYCCIAKRWYQ